jgi:hypothetical protein
MARTKLGNLVDPDLPVVIEKITSLIETFELRTLAAASRKMTKGL